MTPSSLTENTAGRDTKGLKIILLQPPPFRVQQSHDHSAYPHLGLGYLAAYLEKAGYSDITVIDGRMEAIDIPSVITEIVRLSPAVLGITARTHEIVHAAGIAAAVKAQIPSVMTVVGGCHVTAEPQETMARFEGFDFGIAGEGEVPFTMLCGVLSAGENPVAIPGLLCRSAGKVVINPVSTPIAELDTLPFPAWHRFRRSRRSYTVFGSRGCPFDCIFCMRVLGSVVRLRSPANIVDEIDWLVREFEIVAFDFEDETFGLKKGHALEVCRLLMERGHHRRLQWTANLRANLVDEDLLRAMKEAGCVRVAMGVESGNDEILKSIGKGLSLESVTRAFGLARKIGIETVGLFILGHPHESLRTAFDTLRFAGRLNPTQIAVGIMVPYPGTEVRRMALRGEGGYRLLSNSWEDYDKYLGNALELHGLSRRSLEWLQGGCYLWFYLRNLRLSECGRFLWQHQREARILLKKIFRFS